MQNFIHPGTRSSLFGMASRDKSNFKSFKMLSWDDPGMPCHAMRSQCTVGIGEVPEVSRKIDRGDKNVVSRFFNPKHSPWNRLLISFAWCWIQRKLPRRPLRRSATRSRSPKRTGISRYLHCILALPCLRTSKVPVPYSLGAQWYWYRIQHWTADSRSQLTLSNHPCTVPYTGIPVLGRLSQLITTSQRIHDDWKNYQPDLSRYCKVYVFEAWWWWGLEIGLSSSAE